MVPVVTTVVVPAASAQTTPPPHTDVPHTALRRSAYGYAAAHRPHRRPTPGPSRSRDSHADSHADSALPHSDVPHTDHQDSHTDAHNDGAQPPHTDTPHQDHQNHVDAHTDRTPTPHTPTSRTQTPWRHGLASLKGSAPKGQRYDGRRRCRRSAHRGSLCALPAKGRELRFGRRVPPLQRGARRSQRAQPDGHGNLGTVRRHEEHRGHRARTR